MKPLAVRVVRFAALGVAVVGVGLAMGLGALRYVTETDGSTDRALTRWIEVCNERGTYLISAVVGRPGNDRQP